MEKVCHIVSMKFKNEYPPLSFDREVHGELGAHFAELVDEVLRLHGRVVSLRKSSEVGNSTQVIVLASIVLAAEPPTVARIARSLGYSRQAIQKVADGLVAEGYAVYADNPYHKKSRNLMPTEAGQKAYELANQGSAEWTRRISDGLDIEKLKLTLDTLRQVRHRLEKDQVVHPQRNRGES